MVDVLFSETTQSVRLAGKHLTERAACDACTAMHAEHKLSSLKTGLVHYRSMLEVSLFSRWLGYRGEWEQGVPAHDSDGLELSQPHQTVLESGVSMPDGYMQETIHNPATQRRAKWQTQSVPSSTWLSDNRLKWSARELQMRAAKADAKRLELQGNDTAWKQWVKNWSFKGTSIFRRLSYFQCALHRA